MRLNYVGRRTALAMVALTVLTVPLPMALSQNQELSLKSCVEAMEGQLERSALPYSENTVRPGVTRDQYAAAITAAHQQMMAECVRRACAKDVRECKKLGTDPREW